MTGTHTSEYISCCAIIEEDCITSLENRSLSFFDRNNIRPHQILPVKTVPYYVFVEENVSSCTESSHSTGVVVVVGNFVKVVTNYTISLTPLLLFTTN